MSTSTILSDPARYAADIQRGQGDTVNAQFGPITGILQGPTNLGKVVVEGIDIVLKTRFKVAPGKRVALRLNGTCVSKYNVQNLDGTYKSSVDNPAAVGMGVVLRWRHTLSATWDSGPWSAGSSENDQVGCRGLRTSLQTVTTTPVPRKPGSHDTSVGTPSTALPATCSAPLRRSAGTAGIAALAASAVCGCAQSAANQNANPIELALATR